MAGCAGRTRSEAVGITDDHTETGAEEGRSGRQYGRQNRPCHGRKIKYPP